VASVSILPVIFLCLILIAGCIQVPGMHVISDTPDPIIGQWIGGEPPASDLHLIFYENQTFLSINFYLNQEQTTDTGTWTKDGSGRYTTRSIRGEITEWTHDSFFDEIYKRGLPQKKYRRYKG
jgi:hypothetical protein